MTEMSQIIDDDLKLVLRKLSPTNSIVVLDLETTGINSNSDQIIEIGAVKLNTDNLEYSEYSQLINPGVHISEFITELTGISQMDIEDKPVLDEISDTFKKFITDENGNQHLIVAHNAPFDIGFLKKNGFNIGTYVIDTYDLAFFILDKGEYNLEALVNFFNIDMKIFHRAKDDAKSTLFVLIELIKRQINLGDQINSIISKIEYINDEKIEFAPKKVAQILANEENLPSNKYKDIVLDGNTEIVKIELKEINSPNEFFSKKVMGAMYKNFEIRNNQVEMSKVVSDNLSKDKILLVEAAPGTGKTLAYLVPVVLRLLSNDEKIVIATNTIALQDQIIEKDWPIIDNYLNSIGKNKKINIAIFKGRKNYVCKNLINNYKPLNRRETRVLSKVLKWSQYTNTGDINEIDLKNDRYIFESLSSSSDTCINSCKKCFYDKARIKAENSNVILINHSLAFATSQTEKNLLKDIDQIIIDEAHELQSVATNSFTLTVRCDVLKNLLINIFEKFNLDNLGEDFKLSDEYLKKWEDLKIISSNYLNEISELEKLIISNSEKRGSFANKLNLDGGLVSKSDKFINLAPQTILLIDLVKDIIEQINLSLSTKTKKYNNYLNLINNISNLENILKKFYEILFGDDTNFVSWAQQYNQVSVELNSAPISVRHEIANTIFKDQKSIILTGATLSSFGSAKDFCYEIGLDQLDQSFTIDSEFDYDRNVLLCVPEDISDPNDSMYLDTLSSSILEISKSTQEKILILFTSYSSLNKVRKDLKEKFTSLGKDLICQGVDGSANRVIKKFKGKNTILFGTGPLWQGVDFNDDLGIKILYITKLPFAVPTDPLFAARASRYSDSFHEFVLPDAIRRFKQGIGRLLRSNKDYGAIVVSDSRIINKNYGEEFLNAIPGYSYIQSDSGSIAKNISEWLASRD